MNSNEVEGNKPLDCEEYRCSECGRPGTWILQTFSRPLVRCHRHRNIMSVEYVNHVYYNGRWYLIWSRDMDWNDDIDLNEMTMDEVRKIGLEKSNIPVREIYAD